MRSDTKRIDFDAYGKWLLDRKSKLGIGEVPPNDGKRRTPQKRALLKELEERQQEQGKAPVFKANY